MPDHISNSSAPDTPRSALPTPHLSHSTLPTSSFMLEAGAASVDITPVDPQWLDGYGYRTERSTGAYQPITVKALHLRQGERRALLLSAEVLGFDRSRGLALKERIAAASEVPPDSVILAATHTHCAPRVSDMVMPGEVDPAYLSWFEQRCVDAAVSAATQQRRVRVSVSRTEDLLGINRRVWTGESTVMRPNPDGPRDRDVDTLWLEEELTGEPQTSLTIAGCHPTCRGGYQIGGDYPGFLWRELEGRSGGVALFGLGCAGDVRPHFTNPDGGFRPAELAEVEGAGQELAARVLEARSLRREIAPGLLATARRVVEIPLAAPPTRKELDRIAGSDPSPLKRQWAERMRETPSLPAAVAFELQALAMGPDLRIVFWPGEIASEYALWIKKWGEARKLRIFAVAYANGTVGYVPSQAMLPFGGYEVDGSHYFYRLPAPYAADVEWRLRAATLELLDALKEQD